MKTLADLVYEYCKTTNSEEYMEAESKVKEMKNHLEKIKIALKSAGGHEMIVKRGNEAQKISPQVPPSWHHPRVPPQEWRNRD